MNNSILLKEVSPENLTVIAGWMSDPELQKYTDKPIRPHNLITISSLIEESENKLWEIVLNSDNKELIGYTCLEAIDKTNKRARFGTLVFAGEGNNRDGFSYLEAVLLKLKYAFETLQLHRIEAPCFENHPISIPMLLAFGFKKEAIMREYMYKNGNYQTLALYSILKEEYNDLKEGGQYKMSKLINRFVKIKKSKIR